MQAGVSRELSETKLPLCYSPAISPSSNTHFTDCHQRDHAEEYIENATQKVQKSAYQRERRFSSHPRSLQFRMLQLSK